MMSAADDLFADLAPGPAGRTAPPPGGGLGPTLQAPAKASTTSADALFADLAPPEPKRNAFARTNDFMIDAANAAAGLAKAGVDLVAPGSAPSKAIGSFIESGQQSQSDWKKAKRAELGRNLSEADGELDKASVYVKHALTEDPLGTAGEIVGNVGPFNVAGKLLQGANAVTRTAATMGLAGGLSAGEVRGNIFEKIGRTPDAELQAASPEYARLRQSMPEAEAKAQISSSFGRNAPEILAAGAVGALGGKFGLEGMAARVAPARGRLANAAIGVADEATQGAVEQLASNYGIRRALPDQSMWEDVALNAAAEGILGLAGGVVGPTRRAQHSPQSGQDVEQNSIEFEPGLRPGLDVGAVPDATIPAGDMQGIDFTPTPIPQGPPAPPGRAEGIPGIDFEPSLRPSEQMGLDPTAGPMSALAVQAVDTGAAPVTPGQTNSATAEALDAARSAEEISAIVRRTEAADLLSALAGRPDLDQVVQSGLSRPAWDRLQADLARVRDDVAPDQRHQPVDRERDFVPPPSGSFSAMNEFADLLGQESQDVSSRRQQIAETQAQRQAFEFEEADRRTAQAMQREAQARRRAVLDAVLEDPETANPAERFGAMLSRLGFRENAPTAEELQTIQRFQDVRAAQPVAPDIEPSAPNELDAAAMGIRERRMAAPGNDAALPSAAFWTQQAPAEPGTAAAGEQRTTLGPEVRQAADSLFSDLAPTAAPNVRAPAPVGTPAAMSILLDHTNGNGSPDGLAGPENADARTAIVAVLTGQSVAEIEGAPDHKFRTSVQQVERLLYDAAGIPAGNLAARRAPFLDWLDAQTGQQATAVEAVGDVSGEADPDGIRFSRGAGRTGIAAADRAVYGMAAEGKSASDILNFIAGASRSPFNRQLARLLMKTGIAPSVSVGDGSGWKFRADLGSKGAAAAYNPKIDSVELFRPASAERHVLHEMVHAATVRALEKKGIASGQMRALFAHVQKTGKLQGQYGMSNIDEFIAEAFTNPDFQARLKSVAVPSPASSSTVKTAWDWFVRTVRAMLRLPVESHNALSRALEIGAAVMREDRALRRAGQRAGGDGMGSLDSNASDTDPLAHAAMRRQAASFVQAREQAKAFQGKPLTNLRSGIIAMVSRNNLDKMLSMSAVSKSTSAADQSLAVANLDHLFENAEYGWMKPDRDLNTNLVGVHRLFAPMDTADGTRVVKLTVKESAHPSQGSKIYTVEALEIESPASIWVDATVRSDGLDPTSTPYAGHVGSLIQAVQERNAEQGGDSGVRFSRAADVAGAAIDRARAAGRWIAGRDFGPGAAQAFSDLDAVQQQYLGKIGASRTPAADAIRSALDRAGLKIRQGVVDRYAALKELDESLHGKDFIDSAITNSSWVLAKMSSAGSGALNAMMSAGRIAFDAKQKVISLKGDADGGLTAVLHQLGSPAEVERFFGWVAANRADALSKEWIVKHDGKEVRYRSQADALAAAQATPGAKAEAASREHLFAPAEIAAGKRMNTGRTASGEPRPRLYGKVFREFQQYRDDVLAIAEETGIISAENHAMWRDEFYVPFYRVMEDEGSAKGPRAGKGLSRQEAYKKLKGGRENLNDLLENTLMNFHHLLSASLKNQAAAQAIRNAEKLGIARKVPEGRRDTDTSTFVLEGGQRVFYQVDDPLVFEAITSLADPGLNNFAVRSMSAFKRVFTNMTTITPQFVIANTLRDLMQTAATSPTSKNVLSNAVQGTRAFRDDKTRAEMLASGGAFSFGHIYGMDPDEVRASLRQSVRGAQLVSDPSMIPQILRQGWRRWNTIIDASENMSRAATYVQNVEQMGRLRAAFEARDVMDFSQHGAWPAVRFLIRVVPFLNARLQGLDKLYRSGAKPALLTAMGKGTASDREAAARFATVTGALVLASLALYMANADDDEYQKLEEWQKDSYWFFRIGNNAFFLPKPFEVGAIATMAERVAQQFMDDKATGKLFRERLQEMLLQTFAFNPVPQMFQPAIDIYSNKDAFTGRDIETAGMERLSIGLRARDTTTAAGRALSAASRMFGDETPLAVSPVQADHLIRGYLGTVGATGAGMVDTIWRTATGQEAPDTRWSEYQPIRRFYRDLEAPAPYTRYSTLFYDGLRETNRVYADVMELQKLGRPDDARELSAKHRDMLAMRQTLNRAQRRLSEINQQMQVIRRSDRDGEWKRREIDRLNAFKNTITESLGGRVEEVRATM